MIRIITDSACDITARQAQEMGVTRIPLGIHFPSCPYDQAADEDFSQFPHRHKAGISKALMQRFFDVMQYFINALIFYLDFDVASHFTLVSQEEEVWS